jgi:hypothetical protein
MTTINQIMKIEFKGHYEMLKKLHQQLIDRKKMGIDTSSHITNQIKSLKGRIEIYAGLLNGNIEMYDKGLERFKEYGLLILDFLADSKEETNMVIISQDPSQSRRFDRDTLHKNNEAYRQYALFLQEKTDYYTSLRKYFII